MSETKQKYLKINKKKTKKSTKKKLNTNPPQRERERDLSTCTSHRKKEPPPEERTIAKVVTIANGSGDSLEGERVSAQVGGEVVLVVEREREREIERVDLILRASASAILKEFYFYTSKNYFSILTHHFTIHLLQIFQNSI